MLTGLLIYIMKAKLITTASELSKCEMLERSLQKFDWDYDVLVSEYYGFGTKMVNAYRYARECEETHLFIVDSYDVIVLGGMKEALARIPLGKQVWNTEKNAWPYEQWSLLYPNKPWDWKYLNGGACFVEVESFCRMMEANPILPTDNDQVILARTFLTEREKWDMHLDYGCQVFQTLCGLQDGDLSIDMGRVKNNRTGSYPLFLHGNGKHPMGEFYKLI